ncbi:MAG: QueT transporter family protein [Clostridiales bacterium]|nr:QueT transporter family protein [Clostridiales bacterium]
MSGNRGSGYRNTLYVVTSAAVAAVYVILTLPFAQIAYGPLQFRLAESMAVLPILMPAAIPGLALGCFLANLLSPMNLGPVDIIFGSLATLLSAICTRWLYHVFAKIKEFKKDLIALLPPVILNALIVGTYLTFLLTDGPVLPSLILINIAYIALSETVVVYLIGYPLLIILRKSGVGRIWEGAKKS